MLSFFRGRRRRILGSHALSGFSQLAKGEEGGGVAWFYEEAGCGWARAVDSNQRARRQLELRGLTGEATRELMPSRKMRPRMGRLREGVRAEGGRRSDGDGGGNLDLKMRGKAVAGAHGREEKEERKRWEGGGAEASGLG